MDKPLVSVVMPVYNASRFLEKAVNSVINQTYQCFELIMIDDCSKDNSLEIARAFEKLDSRIRVIEGKINQGVARVRNQGIIEAKGDYIALLDSDDVWLPDKLEKQIKLLLSNKASIAYCSYGFIDEEGNEILFPLCGPMCLNAVMKKKRNLKWLKTFFHCLLIKDMARRMWSMS